MLVLLASFAATLVAPLLGAEPQPACTAAAIRAALPPDVAYVVVAGARPLVATEGALQAAACAAEGPARLSPVLSDPAIDFRQHVPLGDGRVVFGGTGGLVVLDPITLKVEPLTTAPPYPAATCWAGAGDDKPVPAWDRAPRALPAADAPDANRPSAIVFERGGPCGYEAEPIRTTMVVDLASRAVRPLRNVPALLVTRGGIVLVADGAPGCHEAQTHGTLWMSLVGGPFMPVPVDVDEPMGFSALAETKDGTIWALTGICSDGGASRGGNLWRAPRGGQWAKVEVPYRPDERGIDQGHGLLALHARGNDVLVARQRRDADRLTWQVSRDGGRTWRATRPGPRRTKLPGGLAATLGVGRVYGVGVARDGTWVWTDDGAFVRAVGATTWTKRFP